MGPAQVDDRMGTVPNLAPGEAALVDWTESDYFADRSALTRSVLGLLPDHPHEFHAWTCGESVGGDSDRMRLGKLLHMAVLEPTAFLERVMPDVVRPENADGRAAYGTPERAAFDGWRLASDARAAVLKNNRDAIPVSAKDFELIGRMIAAVQDKRESRILTNAPGRCEQTIVWREPTTGVLVKVRVDKIVRLSARDTFGSKLSPGLVALDLKTTEDDKAWQFSRSVLRYGYLPQAAMYSDAVEAALGETPSWLFVVLTSEPVIGDKHGASVYALTPEQIARGREVYRSQLLDYVVRRNSNDWTAPHRRGVQLLPL